MSSRHPHPSVFAPSRCAVVRVAAATALAAPVLASATTARATGGPACLHGVASGDPLPDGVLPWTRVTPTPGAVPGSGRGADTVVRWKVAEDKAFTWIAARGSTPARAGADHTVKAEAGRTRTGTSPPAPASTRCRTWATTSTSTRRAATRTPSTSYGGTSRSTRSSTSRTTAPATAGTHRLRQDEAGRDQRVEPLLPDAERHPEGRAGGPAGALNANSGHALPC